MNLNDCGMNYRFAVALKSANADHGTQFSALIRSYVKAAK